ncbi:MAG: cupredoxin domain-containing protein [Chloroflexi bacterium]|nr:cupredoxin domain-containing protein [Chloroflexota bacterium]
MRHRGLATRVAGVMGLGLLLVGVACGSGAAEADTQTTASSGPAQEIKVSMGDFFYDPKDISVEAGRVRFLLSNVGKTAHRFAVTGEGVKASSRNVGAGRESTLEVDLRPGTYKMGCTLGDHEARGSVGIIIVK